MIVRVTLLTSLFILSILPAAASFASDAENKIKAAFLYKFCSYVQWPETTFEAPDSPIVIAVADSKSTYFDVVSTVKGRKINSRPFRVMNIRSSDSLEGVHVLYVGNDAQNTLADFFSTDKKLPILTVTADEDMDPSSIVNFLVVDERVRFDISQARAENVGLKLSSELLAVARRVQAIEKPVPAANAGSTISLEQVETIKQIETTEQSETIEQFEPAESIETTEPAETTGQVSP